MEAGAMGGIHSAVYYVLRGEAELNLLRGKAELTCHLTSTQRKNTPSTTKR